ncbi:hypothetical protein ACAH01_13430 [Halomicrobium sp. HM KBTZ05]|uniref:hypothetical protein n=1 Tax=Halomicrobium sp. HM KBTZ05 TaxID=3242663 RepID=UPI0035579A7E
MIVVDLRETYIAGPVIRALDGIVPHIERAWDESVFQQFTSRLNDAIRQTPVKLASTLVLAVLLVQTLRFVLTPPETSSSTLAALLVAWVVSLLGLRVDWTLAELADSRSGRVTKALFEPPDLSGKNESK